MNETKIVLVTGAAGFLGRHCAMEMAMQGYKVIGIDISAFEDAADWGISSFHKTQCTLSSLSKIFSMNDLPEVILHCAGSGSVPASFQNPYEDFQANVVATLEVMEFCRIHDKSIKIAIPSSAAVYGNVTKLPISEQSELRPISPYGVHKKIIEDLAASYARNLHLNISIVRYFSLYGEGLRKQLLWDACIKAKQDKFSFDGDGNEARDFLHVKDAASLLFIAAQNANTKCFIVNGGTGVGTSIKELVKMIGACFTPPKDPSFSNTKRSGDPTNLIADINELKKMGFTPKETIHSELKNYVKWFQENQNV